MSLINDALKRAKQAQQAAPAPLAGPQFRPIEREQQLYRRSRLLPPVAFIAVLLIGGLLVWRWFPKDNTTNSAQGKSKSVVATSATPAPQTAPSPEAPAQSVVALAAPTPSSATVSEPDPIPLAQANATTNSSAPPKPPPLRLQAIIFHPKWPSAMIGGKMLHVGDKFGELRVIAINQESATLVGAGQTNLLPLPQ